MSLVNFITNYGYIAVFLGSVFEGETVLVLGGFAAHEGYLNMPLIILTAFFGALAGDWTFFFLGRKYGRKVIEKWPRIGCHLRRSLDLINGNCKKMSFSLRFMYGFRSIIPFSIGQSPINTRDFLIYNAAGALLWVIVMGALGYLAGEAMETFIGGIKKHEFKIIIFTVIIITLLNYLIKAIKFLLKKNKKNGCA
jgi:membrane protein DedA with SNARE-associated domain